MSQSEEKRPLPTIRVVAAVIERGGRYLITRRRPSAVLPLLWEFPGGRVEHDENHEDALKREVRHRLGVEIRVSELMNFVSHRYERYIVELHLFACEISAGELKPHHVHELRWVQSDELDSIDFTPADEISMNQLLDIN